ncbi:MAG TPA: hypothetical protein EYG73_11950 [Arcobacter sp.]|nr:hypothetical protein [Arcobacter sp.]
MNSQVSNIKNSLKCIEGKFVHKQNEINIAISNTFVDKKESNVFNSVLIVNLKNKFFFENNRDHLPAILFIEAARQQSMAITHQYYNIGFDRSLLANNINCDFYNFANIYDEVQIRTIVKQKKTKSNFDISFYQNNKKISMINIVGTHVSPRLVSRMEAKCATR